MLAAPPEASRPTNGIHDQCAACMCCNRCTVCRPPRKNVYEARMCVPHMASTQECVRRKSSNSPCNIALRVYGLTDTQKQHAEQHMVQLHGLIHCCQPPGNQHGMSRLIQWAGLIHSSRRMEKSSCWGDCRSVYTTTSCVCKHCW